MEREKIEQYVAWILDDSGNVIRPGQIGVSAHLRDVLPTDTLVCYQCGFEPLVVAVRSVYGDIIAAWDAEEIAAEYLEEIGWFGDNVRDADYIIEPEA